MSNNTNNREISNDPFCPAAASFPPWQNPLQLAIASLWAPAPTETHQHTPTQLSHGDDVPGRHHPVEEPRRLRHVDIDIRQKENSVNYHTHFIQLLLFL